MFLTACIRTAATLALLAVAPLALGERQEFIFAEVGSTYTGAIFPGNPLVGQQVVLTRIVLRLEVFPGANAADFDTDIAFPLQPGPGSTNVLHLTGAGLGWSGAGTFLHTVETTQFNGTFIATIFGAETASIDGMIAEISRVEMFTSAPCEGDCNDDGVLTVADFGCFQTRFVAGESRADCNRDALLTVADFGCFQNAFVAGCP